jgi:tetratricopeptide (TPR) repeat protein
MVAMRSSLVIAALLAATVLSPIARAEPSKADQLFDEGKKLSDAGKWKEACEKFEQAIELDPEAPGTMLNLGRCHENQGHIGTALGWYQKADEHAQKNHMPDYSKAAQERVADLAPRVPSLRFAFAEPLPAGGRLFVDGTEVAPKDQARLPVDPGHHKIDVQVPHKAPIHQEVDVVERVDLEVPIAAFKSAEFVDPGAAQRRHAYLFGGIGAGLFIGQGIVGFGGYFYEKNKSGTHSTWNGAGVNTLTAVGAVGVVGLAYGAYLYLTAPKPYEADHATAFVPVVAPDQVGVAFTGRF